MSSTNLAPDPRIPSPLVAGAVRPVPLMSLYLLIFAIAAVVGIKLGSAVDPDWRFAWQSMIWGTVLGGLVLVVTFVAPELRRTFRLLYTTSRTPLKASDIALFIGLMLTWAFGAHQMLVIVPLIHWHPQFAEVMGYRPHISGAGPIFIFLWCVTSGILAPFSEELFFRGYMQNLWHYRWGLWPGILLSAAFFGAIHVQHMMFATFGGICFSLVYLRTGSLWPGTLLHGLYNLVAAPYFTNQLFFQKSPADFQSLSPWIPQLVLTVAFFPLLYLFWRRFRPNT
jgi:membrane protease YdiL (CAAX protease family)